MNWCFTYAWEEFKRHWSDYIVVTMLCAFILFLIFGGILSTINTHQNKKELLRQGYNEEKLEKFCTKFSHIEYSDLIDDPDFQRFYKEFYNVH